MAPPPALRSPPPLLRVGPLAQGGSGSPWGGGPGRGKGAGRIQPVAFPLAPSRSRTCCRHFLLAQLEDGRHVVLGEDSAHARLQDLLRHYTACPLNPYGETLSQPLARQVRPPSPP